MSDERSKSSDILGIKPVADAVNTVAKAAVDGAAAFLSRICLPAAEEFGLLLRDKIRVWRAKNVVSIACKAERILGGDAAGGKVQAHPHLVGQILERGSWSDVDEVQDLWAGLLVSSCSEDGRDDSNLIFVDLLSRITVPQARILDHACRTAKKALSQAGWLMAENLTISLEELQRVSTVTDLQRLDRELDHLRTFGLLALQGSGFSLDSTEAGITPTALALQMYALCRGHRGDPREFYGLRLDDQ